MPDREDGTDAWDSEVRVEADFGTKVEPDRLSSLH